MKLNISNLDRIARRAAGCTFYYAGAVVLTELANRMIRKAIYRDVNERTYAALMGSAAMLQRNAGDVIRWAGRLPERDTSSTFKL